MICTVIPNMCFWKATGKKRYQSDTPKHNRTLVESLRREITHTLRLRLNILSTSGAMRSS